MKPIGHELIDSAIKSSLDKDEKLLLADGLESAFMGIGRQFNRPVAIYSKRKAIKAIKSQSFPHLTTEEALEYFDFKFKRGYVKSAIFADNALSHLHFSRNFLRGITSLDYKAQQ